MRGSGSIEGERQMTNTMPSKFLLFSSLVRRWNRRGSLMCIKLVGKQTRHTTNELTYCEGTEESERERKEITTTRFEFLFFLFCVQDQKLNIVGDGEKYKKKRSAMLSVSAWRRLVTSNLFLFLRLQTFECQRSVRRVRWCAGDSPLFCLRAA